ncbi:MAG: binary toxin-like calcium binding domain-containing protein [Bacteroidota bacterium]
MPRFLPGRLLPGLLVLPFLALLLALVGAPPAAAQSSCPTGFEIPIGLADGDGDCVPDLIEVTGYTYDASGGGALTPCTPGPADCYVTDPTTWSSDGDPYSDFQEATGINLPTIRAPYGHPLVAASPQISVVLVNYVYTPTSTIQDSRGGSLTQGSSVTVGTSFTETLSATIGSEVSLVDPKVTSEITASESRTTSQESTQSTDVEINWETATSDTFNEAATLALDIRVRNTGSATALRIAPRFNVYIGGELIATIQTPEAFQTTLGPGETSTDVIRVDKRDTGGVTPEDIVLSIPQLRKLRRGAPVELRMVSLEAEVLRWSQGTNNWSCGSDSSPCLWSNFQREIEARTLRLNVDFGYSGDPDATIPTRYRDNPYQFDVFTGSPRVNPQFTLAEVLGFVGFAEGSGPSFAIEGRPFPGSGGRAWVALSGPEPGLDGLRFIDHWAAYALSQGGASWPGDLLAMPMPREANLILLNAAPGPGEAGPVVTGRRFSADQRSLSVSAGPKGGFRPTSATAHLFIQGEETIVEMVPASTSPDGASVTFALPTSTFLPISAEGSFVVVRDGLGNERATSLVTPFGTPATCDEVPRRVYTSGNDLPNFSGGNVTTVFVDGDPDLPASVFCDAREGTADMYFWAPQDHRLGADVRLREIAILDVAHRVVVGEGVVIRSEDGGASWVRVGTAEGVPSGRFWLGLGFRESGTPGNEAGIAVAQDGTIIWTENGGRTWATASVAGTPQPFEAVDYAGGDTWYAVGGDRVIRSTDNGRTWSSVPIPLPSGRRFARLAAVEFISETEGVVGDAGMNDGTGRIYATRDGQTWTETAAYTDHRDIAYNGRDLWTIVGDQGIWVQDDLLVPGPKRRVLPANGARFWNVDFGSPNVGVAVDLNESRNVFRTEDGGETWQTTGGYPGPVQTGRQQLIGVDMLDENVGAVAGYGGTLGATDSGGGVPTYDTPVNTSDEDDTATALPGRVELSTPAPNPVHQSARVRYVLPEASNVRVSVYDVLGREVAVLAEGARPAGEGTVRFDASRLASGFYVLRLLTEQGAATRRVTVVR